VKLIKQLEQSMNQLGELPQDLLGVIKANQKDLMGIKPEMFVKYIRDNTKLKYSDKILLKAHKQLK